MNSYAKLGSGVSTTLVIVCVALLHAPIACSQPSASSIAPAVNPSELVREAAPMLPPNPPTVTPTSTPDLGLESSAIPRRANDDHGDSIASSTAVLVGETVPGEIDADGDIDFFGFDAKKGWAYRIDVTHEKPLYGDRWLFDSNGFELDLRTRVLSSPWIWRARSDEKLYVALLGYFRYTGQYRLKISVHDAPDDHGDDLASSTSMRIGDKVYGELDAANDVDYFRLRTETGQAYRIIVDLRSLPFADVILRDSSGKVIVEDGLSKDDIGWSILWQAKRPENIYVSIRDGGDHVGWYTLTIEEFNHQDDHGDEIHSASEIEVGQRVTATLGTESDVDYFSFDAISGESYEIGMSAFLLQHYVVHLANSSGSLLAGHRHLELILWQATESETLFVRVTRYGTRSRTPGDYAVRVSRGQYEDDHGDLFAKATTVELGLDLCGFLAGAHDQDYFRFNAVAGKRYAIAFDDPLKSQTDDKSPPLPTIPLRGIPHWIFAAKILALDASGRELTEPETGETHLVIEPQNSGNHYLSVRSTGPMEQYRLKVSEIDQNEIFSNEIKAPEPRQCGR